MEMRRSIGLTWLCSALVHGAVFGTVLWGAYRSHGSETRSDVPSIEVPSERTVEIDVTPDPASAVRADVMRKDEVGVLPEISGGDLFARLDTGDDGRSGEEEGAKATHLDDNNDRFFATPDPMSHLTRDQMQRIKSGQTRASWDDRRASKEPSELTFLASGKGERHERRTPSPFDPSRGAMVSAEAQVAGADRIGAERQTSPDGVMREVGAQMVGSTVSRPGVGVRDGVAGKDHRLTANAMHARPDVAQGSVSIATRTRGRTADTVDSEQIVSARLQSIVHASNAGGYSNRGVGGTEGGGEAGAGGLSGVGSRANPLGEGGGDTIDFNTRDPRLAMYFRKVHAKIDPLWRDAFPKSALAELKQGTVILEFTIHPDGRAQVSWPPRRPSGIAEFDQNCANAIRKAGPFDPIPKELGRVALHVRAPFSANNPIVR